MLTHRAGAAEYAGLSLTPNPGLRAFSLWCEKQFGTAFADCVIHPVRGGFDIWFEGFQS